MANDQSKTTQKKERAKTKEQKNKDKLIYIGPNLVQMTKYTVFTEGIPKHVESVMKKCPAVEKLLVPIKNLAYSEQRTRKKGTLEHKHYQEVLSFLSEIRKGDN